MLLWANSRDARDSARVNSVSKVNPAELAITASILKRKQWLHCRDCLTNQHFAGRCVYGRIIMGYPERSNAILHWTGRSLVLRERIQFYTTYTQAVNNHKYYRGNYTRIFMSLIFVFTNAQTIQSLLYGNNTSILVFWCHWFCEYLPMQILVI